MGTGLNIINFFNILEIAVIYHNPLKYPIGKSENTPKYRMEILLIHMSTSIVLTVPKFLPEIISLCSVIYHKFYLIKTIDL